MLTVPKTSIQNALGRLLAQANREVRRPLLVWLICLGLTSGFVSPTVSAKAKKPPVKKTTVKPVVTDIQHERLVTPAGTKTKTIPLTLEINGKGFGKTISPESVRVTLVNIESNLESKAAVKVATDTKIVARAEAPKNDNGSTECRVELEINGKPVDTTAIAHVKIDGEGKPASNPQTADKAKLFEVDFETAATDNPNLHSIAITTKTDEPIFPVDPNLIRVSILPAGASRISVEPGVTPQTMFVDFLAPEDFEVKDVLVTVLDANNKVVAYTKSKKADGGFTITSVDVVSLQRANGFGRVKIVGSGFATGFENRLPRRTESVDRELLCNNANRASQVEERQKPDKSNDEREKDDETKAFCGGFNSATSSEWHTQIDRVVNVALVPRNHNLRVERTQIMNLDDKTIDVYFEFTRFNRFSEPFRLESVTVSVTPTRTLTAANKSKPLVSPSFGGGESDASAVATEETTPIKTFVATHNIGPARDKNLEYRFTIMDQGQATNLFGAGISENFYAIQLSVVNNSKKKVVVPLSSIEAEIEWAYQDCKDRERKCTAEGLTNNSKADSIDYPVTSYDEGPATLSPIPLGTVSGFFDAYEKTKGNKAKLFNILEGATGILSMVTTFKNITSIAKTSAFISTGVTPGIRRMIGDLSGQQLQNLTGKSWESTEEIAAGGSVEKYVFIQRNDQLFSKYSNWTVHKQIKSILGIEISGFEVKESEKKVASQVP